MPLSLVISPNQHLLVEDLVADAEPGLAPAVEQRVQKAFEQGVANLLLHLGTVELQSELPGPFSVVRDLAREYLTRLCHTPALDGTGEIGPVAAPTEAELEAMIFHAPPMRGLEYLTADVLARWWGELDEYVRGQIREYPGTPQEYLREKNPLWRLVGRVTFHLAENKRDEANPFAFLATYSSRLSAKGRLQHLPLKNALQEYAGAKNKDALLALLQPIQRAAEKSGIARELVDSGAVYHPLAWTAREAYGFLREIPTFEESGIVVRVPDWWKPKSPPRPQVSVRIGDKAKSKLGAEALLDFSVGVTLDGEPLSESEIREILASSGGLVPLRGRWVEVDCEKLQEALAHWKKVEREAHGGGISFFEGMRLLAGAPVGDDQAAAAPPEVRDWTGIAPGQWLDQTLAELRDPDRLGPGQPDELHAELRPYQQLGVNWLRFLTRLGLGACLADDMGLGKTIQVISLMLHVRRHSAAGSDAVSPSLLVVPASLLANWKAEIARFAPSLRFRIAHPSEEKNTSRTPAVQRIQNRDGSCFMSIKPVDLVITSYGMLTRSPQLRDPKWNLVILDEAQAIKNSGTRQTRAVKELKANARIALTGTPVENRLSDLWSLFDFLNPGLLGGPKAFARFAKDMSATKDNPYGPLRKLVQPYILRRLKTDKRVIADLPDKSEVNAFCTLSKRQAALYEQAVRELSQKLGEADGIQRRGIVLAYLMRLKQICNHPSQWLGDGTYVSADSGKFQRISEICQELAERQDKVLIFTQFREITAPLAEHLQAVFGHPGLVLHGGTAVKDRRELVEQFQREDGPPFFVLSLKAGGTGLNLTAASHVIHFDRWWNPAVENQATDRAFRIGQKKNVLVHKFVCRGTVEDKIDELIAQKVGLSRELLEGGGEKLLTEMDNQELLRFVALDITRAVEA